MDLRFLPIDEFAKSLNTTAVAIVLRAVKGEFQLFYYHGPLVYKDLTTEESVFMSHSWHPESKQFCPISRGEAGRLSQKGKLDLNDSIQVLVTNKGTYEFQLETPVTIDRDSLMVLVEDDENNNQSVKPATALMLTAYKAFKTEKFVEPEWGDLLDNYMSKGDYLGFDVECRRKGDKVSEITVNGQTTDREGIRSAFNYHVKQKSVDKNV